MSWVTAALGALVILLVLVDLVWTALWVEGGAGPLTRAISRTAWGAFKTLDSGSHRLLTVAGPVILVLGVLGWVTGLWAGWSLLFSSSPASVVASSTGAVADASDRVYFVGYTLFTLGNGDFKPNGAAWQFATSLASLSGLFAITLAITYLLSVISAVVQGRAFASQVSGLGKKPAVAVSSAWDGHSFGALLFPLQTLSSELSDMGEHYLAYPVLQYFHSMDPAKSPVLALATLDQIVAVARYGVAPEERPATVVIASIEAGIENVLDVLPAQFFSKSPEPIPPPSLAPLRSTDRATVTDQAFAEALKEAEDRRSKVAALLEGHGWSPSDVPS